MSAFANEATDISNAELIAAMFQQRKEQVRGQIYWKTQIDFAYNSNKIEGVQLSKHQTRCLFEEDAVVDKAKVDDILETRNHFRMFDYMLDHLNDELSIEKVQAYHRLLMYGTGETGSEYGEWKTIQNAVGDGFTVPPAQVSDEMSRLLQTYLDYQFAQKPLGLEQVCAFHVAFEQIHPFLDGNGRVGRIIMFEQCLTNSIAPFIVLDSEREKYYQALASWPKDFSLFVAFAKQQQQRYKEDALWLLDNNLLLNENVLDEIRAPFDKVFGEADKDSFGRSQ
jgi:Fic family protein